MPAELANPAFALPLGNDAEPHRHGLPGRGKASQLADEVPEPALPACDAEDRLKVSFALDIMEVAEGGR